MAKTLRSVAIAIALVGAAAVAVTKAADTYKLVDSWGQLPAGDTWGEVTGVATNPKGVIVAVRRSEPPILEFDASGQLLRAWGEKMFIWPHGFRIDKDGFLWSRTAAPARGGVSRCSRSRPTVGS